MTEQKTPGARERSGLQAGDGTNPPWLVRIFYDVFGLQLGGTLTQLHREGAELRDRREGGEKGLTGNIKAIDAGIQAEMLRAPASRRHAQRAVTVTVVLIVAVLLVTVVAVNLPLTLITAGAISILAGCGAISLGLRKLRPHDGSGDGEG